jgi:hypothetical protein
MWEISSSTCVPVACWRRVKRSSGRRGCSNCRKPCSATRARPLARATAVRVWGYDYDHGSNIVDVYIGYLRNKLGADLIETARGLGYRLV